MKRFFSMIFALLLIGVICGCQKTSTYSYALSMLRYTEMTGENGFVKYMEKTEISDTDFYSEKAISDEERAACISATEEILCAVSLTERLFVYVFEKENFDGARVEKNTLYLSPVDWKSPDYAANVLLALCSEYGNYGAVCGFACRLCTSLFGTGEENAVFPTDAIFFDLNLLCFDTDFVSETDVEKSKAIAISFAEDYIEKYGEDRYIDILKASGSLDTAEIFFEALETFYQTNGVEYDVTRLLFASGGAYMDYRVLSPFAVFHIAKDFRDYFYEISPLLHEDFLHENYEETKRFFEINVNQMKKYQVLLDLDEYHDDLTVFLGGKFDASAYQQQTHRICLASVSSFTHEYIHSLTLWHGKDMLKNEAWAIEGIANCFRHEYDHYGVSTMNALYNQYSAENDGAEFVLCYKEMIGREIDFAVDCRDLMDFSVYYRHLSSPEHVTAAQESFMRYLAATYGKDAAIGYVCKKGGEYVDLGKSFESLSVDWLLYIQEKFSDYENKKQAFF